VDSATEISGANVQVAARLFAGITLLLTSILNQQPHIAAFQLLVVTLLLLTRKEGGMLLQRAVRLLIWLLLPILLLHAFFTPGELIVVHEMVLPVSFEGVARGGWLALHLAVIFFAALLLFRLLEKKEWLRLAIKLPVWGDHLLVYAALLESGWATTKAMIKDEQVEWAREGKRLRRVPFRIMAMPASMLQSARDDARELWHHWDQRLKSVVSSDEYSVSPSVLNTFLILVGAMLLWLLYFSGM